MQVWRQWCVFLHCIGWKPCGVSGDLCYGSQWRVASQLDEFIQFEVEVEWSILRLLVSLGHCVAEVLDKVTRFFKALQLLLVLGAQVRRAVWIVCCAQVIYNSFYNHCSTHFGVPYHLNSTGVRQKILLTLQKTVKIRSDIPTLLLI